MRERQYEISSMDHITEGILNCQAILEGGFCHKIEGGAFTPGSTVGSLTVRQVIEHHYKQHHEIELVKGGYFIHDTEHLFKFAIVVIFNDENGRKYFVGCSAISSDINQLADYFGVEPITSRDGLITAANEIWGVKCLKN